MAYENIYLWDDPVKSGPIFATVLIVLVSICYYSFVSIVAYTALFIMGTTSGIKIYTCFRTKILKKTTEDPFQYCMGEKVKENTLD